MTIGVDLGATNVRAGIEQNGLITRGSTATLYNKESLDSTLTQLIEFLRPYAKEPVESIGIGVPSVVDVEKGVVYNAVNIPSWTEVALRDILEEEFNLPVYVNNDVNCFILGEHRFGLVSRYRSVAGICIGTGLGTGLIINNELYSGYNCGAGEIGHLPYRDHNLEYYASGNFFESTYGITAMEASLLAGKGDRAGNGMWGEFAEHMAYTLMTMMYTYDPEAIVLGGSLAKAYPLFEKKMKAVIAERFAYPESARRLKIYQSVNDNISLLGASVLAQTVRHSNVINS